MTTSEAWKRFAIYAETLARSASKGACVFFFKNAIVQMATTQQKLNKEEQRRSNKTYLVLVFSRGASASIVGSAEKQLPTNDARAEGRRGDSKGGGRLGRPPCSTGRGEKSEASGKLGPAKRERLRHDLSTSDARYLS